MRPMDKITLRLSPARQQGMTRLTLTGLISTRLSARDARRLWQLIEQLSEVSCLALPVDSPLPWFDQWTGRLGLARALQVRFVGPRGRAMSFRDGEA